MRTLFFWCPLCSAESVERACKGADCVWHMAALVGPFHDRSKYYAVNYGGSLNVLNACRYATVRMFLRLRQMQMLQHWCFPVAAVCAVILRTTAVATACCISQPCDTLPSVVLSATAAAVAAAAPQAADALYAISSSLLDSRSLLLQCLWRSTCCN